MTTKSTLIERVLHVEFANPPLNILSVGKQLVGDLADEISDAHSRPEVDGVILSGAGGNFCAGADMKDFEREPARLDQIRALMLLIENSQKPIIAAIDGLCLGGGLELALAAHHRISTRGAKFAFPEVKLGLLPGAGGTQRAPRLMGAIDALELMLSGKTLSADQALKMGLIDQIAPSDLLANAVNWAPRNPRRSRDIPAPRPSDKALANSRANAPNSLAASHIISCVEAAISCDFDAGLELEARLFAELLNSPPSLALRHGFLGRRIVSRIPNMKKIAPKNIERVSIIGGGLMGTGIAIAVLNAGLKVKLVEPREAGREKARANIEKALMRDVAKGRILQDVAEKRLAGLQVVETIAEAAQSDLFIEAAFESMEVKKQIFEQLDKYASPDAILASNTSTLDLDEIAQFTSRPQSVVGLHFFSPANIMRLLEIVRGAKTAPSILQSAISFAKIIGKTGVVAGVCDGFIGNRIFEEYLRQAWFLLEEGALPEQVDKALEAFGFAMGPCRVMDLAGQDIGWDIRKRRAIEQPDRPYSKVPDLICELGRFGQKTGKGMYLYPDGRTPLPDPEVAQLIIDHSRNIGLERREISDAEIVERCVFAMINEGAKIVEEGIALRPVDIDVVFLDGYGFPQERGGPMFYGDSLGVSAVLEAIKGFEKGRHGWAWKPAALLEKLAAEGGNFGDFNKA